MAATTHRRLVNPLLGIYFGIFASLVTALAILLLILEQLGISDGTVRYAMFAVPLLLYVAIGISAATRDPGDFFAAGRRVPAVFTGLAMAGAATGATGLVAVTGLFLLDGFDAWCIPIGLWSGFVVMALLVAPFLRKYGAYTVPSYLGRRLDNRPLRIVAGAVLVVPTLLIAMAELKMGAWSAARLTGLPEALALQILVIALAAALVPGGMRGLTWSNAGQAIVVILALLLPVSIVGALETNLPLPQLSHGPVLRAIGRLEAMQAVPTPIAPAFAINLAGLDPQFITHRIAHPYASVGPGAFLLVIVTLICGCAAAPWLLPRACATPSVYETRKSAAWAIVFTGLVMLSAAAVAIFLRDALMDQVVGRAPNAVPAWFVDLARLGLAKVSQGTPTLAITDIAVKRDAVLFALPVAAQFSQVVLYVALAGAVAAAMLGASAAIGAIGNIVAEDGVGGLVWEPAPALRLAVARVAITAIAVLTGMVAMLIPADPLDLLLWGFALTASAAFPVVVLSVLWKRLNALGAAVGMVSGFSTALIAILAGEAAWLGLPGHLSATFGIPAGFFGAILATRLAGAPDKHVLAIVREMRLPGGETLHDREIRLQRMKQQRSI